MCTDRQTECVLQCLLASVGILVLFLKSLYSLSSSGIHAPSLSVIVLWYTLNLSMLQKGVFSHSEVTYSTGNIITFGYISRHEAWFNYFHLNVHCYLFFSGVWSILYSFYFFVTKFQAKFWRKNIPLDSCEPTDFLQQNVLSFCSTWEWQQCVCSRAAWTVGIQINAVGLWVPLFIIHWVFFLCFSFQNSAVVQMVLRKFALLQ